MEIPLSVSELGPTSSSLSDTIGYFYWGEDIILVIDNDKNEYFIYHYSSLDDCESTTFLTLDEAINSLKFILGF